MQYCLVPSLLFPQWENVPTSGNCCSVVEFLMRQCGPHRGNSYQYKLLLFPTVGNKIEIKLQTSCGVIEK